MKKLVLKKAQIAPTGKAYRINYEEELNEAQLSAVMHTEGAALILAGAGTGKTRTLIFRVARLVEDGVDPASILLLTFTRKAAREMLRRASALLDGRCDRVAGGTFHSFAYLTLQRFKQSEQAAVSILDQADAEDVMNLVRGKYDVQKLKRRFPKKGTLVRMASASVNTMTPIDEIVRESFSQFVDETDRISEVIRAYQNYKRQNGLFDYDDLLLNLYALTQHEEIGPILRKQYRHVMVDEYQDTNALQHRIIMGLAGKDENVVAVGDDAQSIYAFRGADIQNIHSYPDSFEACKVIRLEHNYRSTQPVLDVCNGILKDAPNMFEKELFTTREGGEQPMLVSCNNERQQSAFVVQQILDARESGKELSEIAVLFRSGFLSFDLEIELAKANIPFRKTGGMKFAEAAHVKDLLAHLRLTVNQRDMISWYRVLLMQKGVGQKTAQALLDELGTSSSPLEITSLDNLPGLRKASALFELLKKAVTISSCHERASFLAEGYRDVLEQKYDDHVKRWKDIETVVAICSRYSTTEEFLADLALDPPNDSLADIDPDDGEDEVLTLSTIHSAKGLEWQLVFVIWVNEGRIPSARSAESEESLEEERRLLYVACTRAKTDLVLTYPSIMIEWEHSDVLGQPSRFLDAVSKDHCPQYVLTEETDV